MVFRSGASQLVLNQDPQLTGSFDRDFFIVLLMTINGQQQIGDKASKDLNHQAVFASCNQVVDFHVSFPPSEEIFDIPAQLVGSGDLLG